MEILKFIERHWSDIVIGLGTLSTLLGLRVKAQRHQATWKQVEKWANAAADSVILWIQTLEGPIDAEEVIKEWRERLLEFATAIGFDVDKDHMRKAMAIANARIGTVALQHNIFQISKVADAMRAKMNNGLVAPIQKTERIQKMSNPPPFGKESK